MTNEEFQYATMTENHDEVDPALFEALIRQQQEMTSRLESSTVQEISSSAPIPAIEEADDDSIEDETIGERIEALKEIFPETLRNFVSTISTTVVKTSKFTFAKGRSATWWISSTMCVLVFPILIQRELLQVAEQISREQRSLLLGPQAASGAFNSAAF